MLLSVACLERMMRQSQLHHDATRRSHYLDASFDKSSPGTGREAGASEPTRVPSAAALRSFDLFVPAKSSRSGDILSAITRLLPAKNSRRHFLWISDAELPRFTSGRVLQRPPGIRVAPIERVIEGLLLRLLAGDYQRFPRSPRSPPRSPPRPPPPPPCPPRPPPPPPWPPRPPP